MKGRVGFKIERRPVASGRVVLSVSLLAILAALVVAGIFFQIYGVSPIHAYQLILRGSLGSRFGLAETVRRAIPLLLCGVGLTIAFRALFWNIGAEGQLLMGAVAAAGVALFSGLPGPLLLPAMFIGGFIGGAVWGLIPAILKVKLGLNDVITTLIRQQISQFLVILFEYFYIVLPGFYSSFILLIIINIPNAQEKSKHLELILHRCFKGQFHILPYQ